MASPWIGERQDEDWLRRHDSEAIEPGEAKALNQVALPGVRATRQRRRFDRPRPAWFEDAIEVSPPDTFTRSALTARSNPRQYAPVGGCISRIARHAPSGTSADAVSAVVRPSTG